MDKQAIRKLKERLVADGRIQEHRLVAMIDVLDLMLIAADDRNSSAPPDLFTAFKLSSN
jgi:hypothetical protein